MKNKTSNILVKFSPLPRIPQKILEFLDSYFTNSSLNYLDDGTQEYVGYTDLNFSEQDLRKKALMANVPLMPYKIEVIDEKNWLAKTFVAFDPFEIADFCVYGNFENKTPKTNKIPIKIDAKIAFGSTHPTTKMCLEAISDLFKMNFDLEHALDIGTGSGILSIAAAKLFSKNDPLISAVDIDKKSVFIARQNTIANHVTRNITVFYSNGYKSKKISALSPYNLIMANIFARPLVLMAQKTAANLKDGGFVIVSGFTKDQEGYVLNAYKKVGFKLFKYYNQQNWSAFLLQKKQNLKNIQNSLEQNEALLIPKNNMFLREDVLAAENKILELTNFSGSAGLLLILKNQTFLFVDGRYTLQVKNQVSKEIEIIESDHFYQSAVDVIKKHNLLRLICNPWSVSQNIISFFTKNGIDVVLNDFAEMSALVPNFEIFIYGKKFSGFSSKQRYLSLLKNFSENADALLICSPEIVSWLSNLRASDLPYTPVVRAYALLHKNGNFKLYLPDKFQLLIKDIKKCKHVLISETQTPVALISSAPQTFFEKTDFDFIFKNKLQKNLKELEGFKKAHIRDGIALVKFLYWLEKTPKNSLTELDIVQKLHDLRSKQKNYFSESFETISAVNQNAAIVHYTPSIKTNKKLSTNGVLLIDSGGQYLNGTTDVTRTISLGRVSDEIKISFTQVLKAHIALASYEFKEKTKACLLDEVCRSVLQQENKNYKHGTGHSVGYFSNVHEEPFSIGPKSQIPVLENYVTSIEPGYYKENSYGIRIENLFYTKKAQKEGYLCFDVLTLCPIDKKLIKADLLTNFEKQWLNNYHQKVFDLLKPYLKEKEIEFLEKACQKIN